MKIAIIGYGKMGKTIEGLAKEAGDEIIMVIDEDNKSALSSPDFAQAEVAIEFTRPESAYNNIVACFKAGVPVVSGTTAWLDQYEDAVEQCKAHNGGFFYASNYSIGVNIFFALNRQLAKMMDEQEQYKVLLEEIHHTSKLDAPSGTAITLAEGVLDHLQRKTSWVNDESFDDEELPILSKRIDPTPGTHTVSYNSLVDTIQIQHVAHTREGFAKGALAAARWLVGKQGVYGMSDMLGF
ncbi:MAG TPA: 4-hydroxy-tetrahydrodipicolinate reductase [Saprospiraceae bacterium]|nr:4-hydroxy-tetrahydrodipicolinate reductase [Saprospiraceae bacterium]